MEDVEREEKHQEMRQLEWKVDGSKRRQGKVAGKRKEGGSLGDAGEKKGRLIFIGTNVTRMANGKGRRKQRRGV